MKSVSCGALAFLGLCQALTAKNQNITEPPLPIVQSTIQQVGGFAGSISTQKLGENYSTHLLFLLDSIKQVADLSDYFQLEVMRGFVAAHTQGMQELYRHTSGLQLHLQRNMLRNQYHPSLFKKPLYYGTTINYQSLGSDAAGYAIGLGFSLFIPSGHQEKTKFTVGMGGGYISMPYSINNPKNIAIGSHINGMMRLGIQRDIWRGRRPEALGSMQVNLGMTHFSNGNWSQPNLGVNIPYFSLAYRYKILSTAKKTAKATEHIHALQALHRSFESNRSYTIAHRTWGLIGGIRAGIRQMEIDQEANFTIGVVELLAERKYSLSELSTNSNLRSCTAHPHFGLTVFLDRTYQYNKPNPLPEYRFSKTTELALLIGNRYVFGRVGVLTDVGFYLYRPGDAKRRYFQALGLSYLVNQRIIMTARLKVHLSSADYIEWGLGYRI